VCLFPVSWLDYSASLIIIVAVIIVIVIVVIVIVIMLTWAVLPVFELKATKRSLEF